MAWELFAAFTASSQQIQRFKIHCDWQAFAYNRMLEISPLSSQPETHHKIIKYRAAKRLFLLCVFTQPTGNNAVIEFFFSTLHAVSLYADFAYYWGLNGWRFWEKLLQKIKKIPPHNLPRSPLRFDIEN